MQYLDDLALGAWFSCGGFSLTRAQIIAFATAYDPQPFHLDDAAAEKSYFGRLCASGLHTQAMAVGLMVPAIANVAVVAGYSLNQARFLEPTWPGTDYTVRAAWTSASPSPANPARGRATLDLEVAQAGRPQSCRPVARLGVTYVIARRPTSPE